MTLTTAASSKSVPKTPEALRYRPDIDGLRAVAVLAVIGFHADLAVLPGGFVGVDVFFVISGYLITSIIWRELALGRFAFADFYARRFRRIMPALFVMSLGCTLAAAVVLIPSDFEDYGRSLIAMALFASNMFFAHDTGVAGYFHVAKDPPLLLHTWSLALEEQFYILLPPALLALDRLARRFPARRFNAGRFNARRFVVPTLCAAIALSFALSVVMLRRVPTDAFYLIAPRAWELLIGSLLAVMPVPAITARSTREVASAAGLGMIVYAILTYSRDTPFPGLNALLPCGGAFLLILVGGSGRSFVTGALSLRPVRFVGKISYSLYLWHWPIIAVLKYLSFNRLTFATTVAALLLSLGAATLSYVFVETPFRTRKIAATRSQLARGAIAATACLLVTGAAILVDGGMPWRFDAASRAIIAANLARESQTAGDDACDNYRSVTRSIADLKQCPLSHGEKRNILFWGDSHMGEMRPVIESLYEDGALGGRGATFAIAPACPASISMDHRAPRLHCDAIAKTTWERARQPDIDLVFIYFTGWRLSEDNDLCLVDGNSCAVLSKDRALSNYAREVAGYTRDLRALGKRVVVGLPDPSYGFRIPHLQILKAALPRLNIVPPLRRYDFDAARETITAVAKENGASIFDPRRAVCTPIACRYEKDEVSMYADDNHFAKPLLLGMFRDRLRKVLSSDPIATR